MINRLTSILRNTDEFISGEDISKKLGLTQNDLSEMIDTLKKQGYEIQLINNNAYRISDYNSVINEFEISNNLNTSIFGREIFCYNEIDSTNNQAKKIAKTGVTEGAICISRSQSLGKGRMGRIWFSEKGAGIFLSLILRPNINILDASQLTLIAGISVKKTIDKICGVNCDIKWPNDILLNNKKICGILTESNAEIDKINFVVVGIGINVNNIVFENDLSEIATSIFIETNKKQNFSDLIKFFLEDFEKAYNIYTQTGFSFFLNEYKNNCITLNKNVKIFNKNQDEFCKVIDINKDGSLLVKLNDGTTKNISSGEVSIQ